MYALALEILIEEFIQLFLFDLGQGVDLGAEVVGIWHKFNGVVPFLLIGQFIKGLLSENIMEFLVWLSHYFFKVLGQRTPRGFRELLGDGLSGSNLFHPSSYELNEELVILV